MRVIFGGLLALMMSVGLSVSAFAQSDADYQARLDLSREISTEMLSFEAHEAAVETSIPLLRMSYETIPGVSMRQVQAALDLTEEILVGIYPETIEANAEIYAARFSLEELQALHAFNQSEMGQKMNRELPSIMREMAERRDAIGSVAVENQMARFRAIFSKTS